MGSGIDPPESSGADVGAGLPAYRPKRPEPGPPGVPGPLGVAATLATAFGLYRADLLRLWGAVGAVAIPLQLLIYALEQISAPRGASYRNGILYLPPGVSGAAYAGFSGVGILLTLLSSLLASGAIYRIVLGRHLHHPAGVVTSLAFALERFLPLLWVSVLFGIAVFLGLVLLIVPGIWLGVTGILAIPVLMAEDRRGVRAIIRSARLVQGKWWHVLGTLIVAGVALGIGQGLCTGLIAAITGGAAPHSLTAHLLGAALGNGLAQILLAPFLAAAYVVLYVDMLLRKGDPQLVRLLA